MSCSFDTAMSAFPAVEAWKSYTDVTQASIAAGYNARKRNTMTLTLARALVVCCLLPTCNYLFAEDQQRLLPAPGPENAGLRLQLLVANHSDHEETHDVRLQVTNVGKDRVTLVGQFYYENDSTYRDFLREAVYFTSFPEVLPSPFSTKGSERRSPQPTATIAPGDSLVVEWKTRDNAIGGGRETHQDLTFDRSGLFLVRAHLVVRTADDKFIKLWSNEQSFIVGGSWQAPQACAATVTKIADKEESIQLDVGIYDGIQVGDVFEVGHPKTRLWSLKVSEVTGQRATASLIGESGLGSPGKSLHVGSKARFVRNANEQVR